MAHKRSDVPTEIIDICYGDDHTGAEVFVCLKITFDRYPDYKAVIVSGAPFDPHEYGEIIASGNGKPPASLISKLKKKYALIENFDA